MPELKESNLVVKFDSPRHNSDGGSFDQTSNIEEWSIQSSYLQSTDGFTFTIIDDDLENLRNLECQSVSLYVGGALQLIGRIDQTTRGDRGRSVTCSGRDYLADLVECNIDPTFVVKEGETFGPVVIRAASPVGIIKVRTGPDVSAARNVRTGRSFGDPKDKFNFKDLKQEDLKPDPGQGIYEFLKKICERHGCTIQPDVTRDSILLASPLFEQEVSYKITRTRGSTEKNNVDSATATRDYSSFPSLVIVQGNGSTRSGEQTRVTRTKGDNEPVVEKPDPPPTPKPSTNGPFAPGDNEPVVEQPDAPPQPKKAQTQQQKLGPDGKPERSDTEIDTWAFAQQHLRGDGDTQGELGRILNDVTWSGRRKPGENNGDILAQHKIYRLNYFRDKISRGQTQLAQAANRILCEHLKNSLVYEVTLTGHIDPWTGAVWSIDTIVDVNDDICDVHEKLWVMDRTLTFGAGGAKTKLKCIRPGSFEI